MASNEDRLTRLETIIEEPLKKIASSLEVLPILESEASENKEFRGLFQSKVKEIVNDRLNTSQFDYAIKEKIDKEVMAIFDKKEVREDFDKKVKDIITQELKEVMLSIYVKITLIVSTIATGLVTFILKGLL